MAGNGKSDKPILPKRSTRTSFSGKRGSEWIFSDVPSDIVIEVDGICFALHKFPLVSRSGRIRKLVADGRDSDVSKLEFPGLPGGAETFELTAKFCYGINFEITTSNVAPLCCAAEYLEMTEEYAEENLVSRTEVYMEEIVSQSLEKSLEVLQNCDNLLPLTEELKIVSRCIDAIASKACREQIASSFSRLDYSSSGRLHSNGQPKNSGDWWVEDLSVLPIGLYQRVITAMKSRGVRHESIGASLMHYAQHSLKGLSKKQSVWDATTRSKINAAAAMEHEQRILVETIVSLLPSEKNTVPISFLFGLLRTAVMLDTTVACRLDLERRIGLQLDFAILDDLLIPSFLHTGDTLFDVDIVHRILVNFLQQDDNQDHMDSHSGYESDGLGSPSQTAIIKVAKLIDGYLAEIAPDTNLKLSKFIAIAELLPDYARVVDDGLYRAIDIYLKAHPGLIDMERKKLCKLIDYQKLSQEACAHAAQNERLPVQAVVQVLYFEQLRLRNALAGSHADGEPTTVYQSQRVSSGVLSAAMSPKDNYASLRRENRELKLEIARMRMRLNDLEKEHVCMKKDMEIKYGLLHGGNCFRCYDWCRLPIITPCRHLLCLDCVALDSEKCTLPGCGYAYKMQSPEILTRPENPNPKWPVPEDLIELQPSYNQDNWDPDWHATTSSKVAYLVEKLKVLHDANREMGYCLDTEDLPNDVEVVPLSGETSYNSAAGKLGCEAPESSDNPHRKLPEKAIIFSQFLEHIHVVERQLTGAGIKYTGMYSPMHSSNKMKSLMTFQHDTDCMALIMDGSAALGLDLSFVTYVFLMEPIWDRSMEEQVISRAHRMGATRPIHVETLAMRGTIEEQMLEYLHDPVEHRRAIKEDIHTLNQEGQKFQRTLHDFAESNYLARLSFVRTKVAG